MFITPLKLFGLPVILVVAASCSDTPPASQRSAAIDEPGRAVNEAQVIPASPTAGGPSVPSLGTGRGRINIVDYGPARIHSYTAPEDSELVNSHIIELQHELVIIDAQFFRPYALQFKAYVDSIGKPVNRVILSHQHPDHWFGLEYFPGVLVSAHDAVAGGLAAASDFYLQVRREEFGELVTDRPARVNHLITVGDEIIDGVRFEYELIRDAEAGAQTFIRLPEFGALFVQDVVCNNAHAFFASPDLQPWINNLRELAANPRAKTIFVGHGFPAHTTLGAVDRQIEYLVSAKRILAEQYDAGIEALVRAMKEAYPDLGAAPLVDISAWFYFTVSKPRMDAGQ